MPTALNPLNPLQVPREVLRPPSSDSPRTGLAMSVLAHALLVAGLTLGVQWHSNDEPDGVEAELWSAVPQLAAPRAEPPPEPQPEASPPPPPAPPPPEPMRKAPAPPPPPTAAEREAEIATERAEKLKREKERQEAEDQRARERRQQAEKDKKAQAEKERQERAKAEQEARQKAEQKAEQEAKQKAQQAKAAEQKRLQAEAAQREKLRQEQIQRMQAQLGGTGGPDSVGTAARSSGPSSGYAGRIRAYIKSQNRGLLTSDVPGNPEAEIEVTLAPDGTIRSAKVLKSSGSAVWDDLARRAVERTGSLPQDVDGRVPPLMVITLKPN